MNYDSWKAHNPADEFLGPLDPEDRFEYEDRQEVLRSMGRVMDDKPQDNNQEEEQS